MGTFRTVLFQQDCKRCRKPASFGAQFKTGNDREMPEYLPGDVVDDLEPGSFPGIADNYCGNCFLAYEAAECRAMHEVLANWVEAAKVTIHRDGKDLAPDEIRRIGEHYAAARAERLPPIDAPPPFSWGQWFLPFTLRHGRPLPPPPSDFYPGLMRETEARLRADGWAEMFCEDFTVVIDDDRRVWVEDGAGKRLAPPTVEPQPQIVVP